MLTVDGIAWPWPCDVTREASVASSRISALMLDGSYFNDVLGTYMRYTVSVAVPAEEREAYARLYETLTDPVDGHRFALPYAQGTLELTGRVERVEDIYVRGPGDTPLWRGGRFTVTANHPTKTRTLAQTLAAGRAPFPDIALPEVGDCYTFDGAQWVEAERFESAEGREY